MRRHCANCLDICYPRFRYCIDCWRMVAKTVISSAAAALGVALANWLTAWLHR